MLNDLAHLFLALVWSEGGTRWSWGLRQWARLVGWLVGQPVFWVFQVGWKEQSQLRDRGGSWCLMLSDHRCLRSALYMAKPSTANTVAPTLALSQKVEFFRSAWAMCLSEGISCSAEASIKMDPSTLETAETRWVSLISSSDSRYPPTASTQPSSLIHTHTHTHSHPVTQWPWVCSHTQTHTLKYSR